MSLKSKAYFKHSKFLLGTKLRILLDDISLVLFSMRRSANSEVISIVNNNEKNFSFIRHFDKEDFKVLIAMYDRT